MDTNTNPLALAVKMKMNTFIPLFKYTSSIFRLEVRSPPDFQNLSTRDFFYVADWI